MDIFEVVFIAVLFYALYEFFGMVEDDPKKERERQEKK